MEQVRVVITPLDEDLLRCYDRSMKAQVVLTNCNIKETVHEKAKNVKVIKSTTQTVIEKEHETITKTVVKETTIVEQKIY